MAALCPGGRTVGIGCAASATTATAPANPDAGLKVEHLGAPAVLAAALVADAGLVARPTAEVAATPGLLGLEVKVLCGAVPTMDTADA
mmetsp:Transcript_130848/g.261037  ORF Transcript_130848/g.261037 Transcript_130848/m.261037 type:complete len:88 (-) Transcript_130848:326-589(-)